MKYKPIASSIRSRHNASVAASLLVLLLAAVALFVTAPKHDDFWWSDAPEHAMNGALVLDYLKNTISSLHFSSPLRFASNYYLHYPALTIAAYPPLFPVVEAMMFSVMGVSHFAAQLTVSIFGLALAYSLYSMARTALPPVAAGGVALLFLSTPVVALWSRQVMLEIPCLALLAAAAGCFLRSLEDSSSQKLYVSIVLLCGAIYTKQTAAFAVIPIAATLLIDKGWVVLREGRVWLAALLGFLVLSPLGVFTIVFALHDLQIVAGIGPEAESQFSLSSVLFYARHLPAITGPTPIAAALSYLAILAWKGWRSVQERRLTTLMIAWFVADYVFISSIAHREERYGIFLVLPVVVLAMMLLFRVLPRVVAEGAAFVGGALAFVLGIVLNPVPRVSGYDAIATYILHHSKSNGVVLFHGLRSPFFVFAERAQSPSPEIYLLRSEKVLERYKVHREWGIHDRNLSRAEIEKMIDRYGIEYVVFQPDFWTDLPSLAALQDFIYSDQFSKVAEFPITANIPISDNRMYVFRNKYPTNPIHPTIELDIPMLHGRISGTY